MTILTPEQHAERYPSKSRRAPGRASLWEATGEPCPYCAGIMVKSLNQNSGRNPTRDHMIPKVRGGGRTLIVCSACNLNKGNFTLREWLAVLLVERDRRAQHVAAVIAQNKADAGADLPPGFVCTVPASPATRGRHLKCGYCGVFLRSYRKAATHYAIAHADLTGPMAAGLASWHLRSR